MSAPTPPKPRERSARLRALPPLAAVLLLAGAAAAQPYGLDAPVPVGAFLNGLLPPRTPTPPGGTTWEVTPAFPNLALPDTLVIVPNPSDNRLYVGSRGGVIVSFDNDPNVTSADPFLDLSDRVAVVWDGGFLGMTFHPEFGVPGSPNRNYLYAYYASNCPLDAARTAPDMGACIPLVPQPAFGFFDTWLRLSRFEVPDGQTVADKNSETVLLNIRLYNDTHRGGGMVFGDDGYLYLTIGDQARRALDTAQRIDDNLEGGTMRFAVDITDNGDGTWSCPAGSHLAPRTFDTADEISGQLYCIPDDNPWLDPGGSVFEEYFSIGHRNPHRLAKDPANGRLWSGEVGQLSREEINVIEKGNNYGWPFREGLIAGPNPPPPVIHGVVTDPVIDFVRSEAISIIGGYVYRGTRFPSLTGRYLAGDWGTNQIWAIDLDPVTMTATKQFLTNFTPGFLGTWGQDNQGEVYLGSVSGSHPLYTLNLTGTPVPEPPSLLSQTGAFADVAGLVPASFWLPYQLNQPFWSDGGGKSRWIAVPNDGTHDTPAEQISYSPSSDWSYPIGTVFMKHFELGLDETDPSVTTRLETRMLAYGDDGNWYGVTYRWLPDQSDAQLLTTSETADYTIQLEGGGTRTQTWLFPSRGQCLSCHRALAGGGLGPRTHQLHGPFTYPSTGITDNQLRTWNHLGMFSPAVDEATLPTLLQARALGDVTASLEDRARTYLDVNCAYCHRPGSAVQGLFDARLTTPLLDQGLVYGPVINGLGIPGAAVIVPGDLITSTAYHRTALLGPGAMPPLAKNLVDQPAVDLLGEWILRIDPGFPQIGVDYEYYEVVNPTAMPDFDSLTPVASGAAADFDISLRNRDNEFAFRFSGYVEVDTDGTYTFYTNSDDGSQLFIDATLVVDNDGPHPLQERSGTIALTAGLHAIVVTYFEQFGQEALGVSWQGPGIAKQAIPPSRLFRALPSALNNAAPVLSDPGYQMSKAGRAASLALAASDADGDSLYFGATGLPPGLALDPSTGVIAGTLPVGSQGLYAVTVGVSDGPDVDSLTFSWVVERAVPRACGLGFELALVVPALAALGGRRRRSGRPGAQSRAARASSGA